MIFLLTNIFRMRRSFVKLTGVVRTETKMATGHLRTTKVAIFVE